MTNRFITASLVAFFIAGCTEDNTTTVNIHSPPAPYSLTLTAPLNVVSGSFDVEAIPSPEAVTLEIEFFLDGQYLGRDITSPYRLTITKEQAKFDGQHEMLATALQIDRRTAKASASVWTDNTSPDIKLVSPNSGERILASERVPIRFDLPDAPSDLLALRASFLGQPLEALPLPQLEGTVTLPPENVFPIARNLAWEAIDTAGNVQTGATSVTLSHVRLDLPLSSEQGFLPFVDHGTLVGSVIDLRAYGAKGDVQWSLPAPSDAHFAQMYTDGVSEVHAVLAQPGAPSTTLAVARIRPNGTIDARYPASFDSEALLDVVYDRKSKSFVASHFTVPSGTVQTGSLVEIDQEGTPKPLYSLPTNRVALDVQLSRDTVPPVLALLTHDTSGVGAKQLEVLSRNGTPLWKTDIPNPDSSFAGIVALTADVALIIRWRVWPDCLELTGVGPSGPLWSYSEGCFEHVRIFPGGDLLIVPNGTTMVRLRSNGTIAWTRPAGVSHDERDAGILVTLNNPEEVRLMDHDGNTRQTFYPPQDLETSSTTTRAFLIPSGGFYVLRTRFGTDKIRPKATVWRVKPDSTWAWREDIDGVQFIEELRVSEQDDDVLVRFRQPAMTPGTNPQRFYRLIP